MRRHLLVTNDFPPKVGGIQSYLWELWRRLPPGDISVHTTPYPAANEFDVGQDFEVTRSREPVLLPYPWLRGRVDRLAEQFAADLTIWDPAVPVGMSAPRSKLPYAVVLHGAEVTIPGRLPVTRTLLARVLNGASLVICAGRYVAAEAERAARRPLPTLIVPPGVDTGRFSPLDAAERDSVRSELGLPTDAPVVVGVSRLVPRKGMDTLIRAAGRLRSRFPDLVVAIAGSGRDQRRLKDLVEHTGAPVRILGRLPDSLLPGLYGAGEVFAMPCRSRWRGLEQEGFGIVFVEAAACGVPQIAGESGGAAEAVEHGVTGLVLEHPESDRDLADAIADILEDEQRRTRMGLASRERALREYSYDVLARRLEAGIDDADLQDGH